MIGKMTVIGRIHLRWQNNFLNILTLGITYKINSANDDQKLTKKLSLIMSIRLVQALFDGNTT